MAKKPKKETFDYESFEQEAIEKLKSGGTLVGEDGVLTGMIQRLVNAALEGEMSEHLVSEKAKGKSNRRNGHTQKKIRSDLGKVEIQPPRDRLGSFTPQIVGKWDRELGSGVSNQILALYARGQGVRQIQSLLYEIYGLEYSTGTISAVTDAVLEEIITWQNRALESCYPVIFLDAIHYKVREDGQVKQRAIYTVFGIDVNGQRDVLGLYIDEAEGAHRWGLILEDIRKRGVEDVFWFCVDGLAGFKEAIEAVFPHSIVQRCIVHMIRSSTRFVADKDRRAICQDLRTIYTATNLDAAELALESFSAKWDKKYPQVSRAWRENWLELTPFLDYGEPIRRMIYTTNAVEALHRIMRQSTKTKGAWINEKGLMKQLYLALSYSQKSWRRKVFKWSSIQLQLMEKFGDRYTKWAEKA
jgi:transposase-like protein